MRTNTDGSFTPWPLRIFRPWIVATVGGGAFGVLLLALSPQPLAEENGYAEFAPRAAVYDAPSTAGLVPDPFAPAPSLSAPGAARGAAAPPGMRGAVRPAPPPPAGAGGAPAPGPRRRRARQPTVARQSTKTSNCAQNTRSSMTSGYTEA